MAGKSLLGLNLAPLVDGCDCPTSDCSPRSQLIVIGIARAFPSRRGGILVSNGLWHSMQRLKRNVVLGQELLVLAHANQQLLLGKLPSPAASSLDCLYALYAGLDAGCAWKVVVAFDLPLLAKDAGQQSLGL
jgi:hypothetical protein